MTLKISIKAKIKRLKKEDSLDKKI